MGYGFAANQRGKGVYSGIFLEGDGRVIGFGRVLGAEHGRADQNYRQKNHNQSAKDPTCHLQHPPLVEDTTGADGEQGRNRHHDAYGSGVQGRDEDEQDQH